MNAYTPDPRLNGSYKEYYNLSIGYYPFHFRFSVGTDMSVDVWLLGREANKNADRNLNKSIISRIAIFIILNDAFLCLDACPVLSAVYAIWLAVLFLPLALYIWRVDSIILGSKRGFANKYESAKGDCPSRVFQLFDALSLRCLDPCSLFVCIFGNSSIASDGLHICRFRRAQRCYSPWPSSFAMPSSPSCEVEDPSGPQAPLPLPHYLLTWI